MKTCSRCKVAKPLTAFDKRTASKDGKQAYCRECMKIVNNAKVTR